MIIFSKNGLTSQHRRSILYWPCVCINSPVFAAWYRLVNRVENSVYWLSDTKSSTTIIPICSISTDACMSDWLAVLMKFEYCWEEPVTVTLSPDDSSAVLSLDTDWELIRRFLSRLVTMQSISVTEDLVKKNMHPFNIQSLHPLKAY